MPMNVLTVKHWHDHLPMSVGNIAQAAMVCVAGTKWPAASRHIKAEHCRSSRGGTVASVAARPSREHIITH